MVRRLTLFVLVLASLMLAGCARAAEPMAPSPSATTAPPATEAATAAPTLPTATETIISPESESDHTITGIALGDGRANHDFVPPTFDMELTMADGTSQTISVPVDAVISLPSGRNLPSAHLIRPCMTLAVMGSMEGERFVAEEVLVVEAERLPVSQVVARTTHDALDLLPNPESPKSLELLPQETGVSVRGQCGEWLQVTTANGENGWVRRADLTTIDAPLPTLPHFPGSAPGGDPGMSLTPITVTARVIEVTGYRIEIGEANPHRAITLSESTPITGPDGGAATLGDIRPGVQLEITGYDFGPADDEILAQRIVILSLPD